MNILKIQDIPFSEDCGMLSISFKFITHRVNKYQKNVFHHENRKPMS